MTVIHNFLTNPLKRGGHFVRVEFRKLFLMRQTSSRGDGHGTQVEDVEMTVGVTTFKENLGVFESRSAARVDNAKEEHDSEQVVLFRESAEEKV